MTQRHPIQNGLTMLVTTITKNRLPIFSHPAFAHEAVNTIYRVQTLHPFLLFGFVIMPDHCHFLIRVMPPGTISGIMNVFKSGTTFNIGMGPIWQRRFHIRIVRNKVAALRYIHTNPISKGLAKTKEEYAWSSAYGIWKVSSIDE